MARYEARRADTGVVLRRHRTRQGALDRWRTDHRGIPVAIWRTYSGRAAALVVEGTWSEDDTEHDEGARHRLDCCRWIRSPS